MPKKERELTRFEAQAKERIEILITEYCNGRAQELVERTGISKASVSQYRSGYATPSNLAAEKLCAPFGLNPAWLMGFDVPRTWAAQEQLSYRQEQVNLIPLIGRIAAGPETWVYDDVYDWVPYKEGATKEEYYALTISGDSMAPTLVDGDMVYVKSTTHVQTGDIAVVVINGDEGTCKEVHLMDNGIMLIGHNQAAYKPRFYSAEEIETLPVQIKGKVVDMRRSFE